MKIDIVRTWLREHLKCGDDKVEELANGLFDQNYIEKYEVPYEDMVVSDIFTDDKREFELQRMSRLIDILVKSKASRDEIADVMTYLMVIIDAQKKNLNWRQCYIDKKIEYLKRKYVLPHNNLDD